MGNESTTAPPKAYPFGKMSRPEARRQVREALQSLLLAFAPNLKRQGPDELPALDLPDGVTR